MGWYICFVVACLVQSQIQAYPADIQSANHTLEADLETKLNIAIPSDHTLHASANSKTTATVTIITPDGQNETAVSITNTEVTPDDGTEAELMSSNIHLNVKTKVFIEITPEQNITAVSKTIAEIAVSNLEGDFANSTAEVSTDTDGNEIAKTNSTVSSNNSNSSPDEDGSDRYLIIINAAFEVQLPKHGENITATANTTAKMLLIELDGRYFTSESFAEAEPDGDDFNNCTTVVDMGNGRMQINIRTKVTAQVPHGGLPTAESKTTANVLRIAQNESTSLISTNLDVSVDGNTDDEEGESSSDDSKTKDVKTKDIPPKDVTPKDMITKDVATRGVTTKDVKPKDTQSQGDDISAKLEDNTQAKKNIELANPEVVVKPEAIAKPKEVVTEPEGATKPKEVVEKPEVVKNTAKATTAVATASS